MKQNHQIFFTIAGIIAAAVLMLAILSFSSAESTTDASAMQSPREPAPHWSAGDLVRSNISWEWGQVTGYAAGNYTYQPAAVSLPNHTSEILPGVSSMGREDFEREYTTRVLLKEA